MSLVLVKNAANGGLFSMDIANTDPAIGYEFKGAMDDTQIQYVNQFIEAIRAGQAEIEDAIPQVFPMILEKDAAAVYQQMFVDCNTLLFNAKVLIPTLEEGTLSDVLERVAVELLEVAA